MYDIIKAILSIMIATVVVLSLLFALFLITNFTIPIILISILAYYIYQYMEKNNDNTY